MSPKTSEKEVERCLENLENPCRMPKYAPKNVRLGNINCNNTENNRGFTVSFWLAIAIFILGMITGFIVTCMLIVRP